MRKAEQSIEKRFVHNHHIALGNLNFDWTIEDKEDFEQMYWRGSPLEVLARHFKRDEYEIIVMALDCRKRGRKFKV